MLWSIVGWIFIWLLFLLFRTLGFAVWPIKIANVVGLQLHPFFPFVAACTDALHCWLLLYLVAFPASDLIKAWYSRITKGADTLSLMDTTWSTTIDCV
jgi:hypothetical protein